MHKVLVNRLGDLSLPRKSVLRLTDRPDMTLDLYCGRKTTIQQQQICDLLLSADTAAGDKKLPAKTVLVILFPAETLSREQKLADSLCRKQFFADSRIFFLLSPSGRQLNID